MISAGDVDRAFNAAVIRELAAFFPANADLTQLAPNIRDAARQFIQAKGHLSAPQIRAEIKRLYSLTNRGLRDDRAARQLARAISYMNADAREWLIRCNPPGREIPSAKEVENIETRSDAINKLRVILSYGGKFKQGRKRPSGKRSRSMDPLLRVPIVKKERKKEGRPRSASEREFIRNLSLAWLEATGKRSPYKVDFTARSSFSRFVHRCFELVGAPTGNVTRLINEFGRARRAAVQQLRRRVAIHEAGHAILAFASGLVVEEIAIGVCGDNSAGESKIEHAENLPLVDQIALCLAGIEAQRLLGERPHEPAAMQDHAKIADLIGDNISEVERLRDVAGTRARALLKQHRVSLEALATAIAESGRLTHQKIERFRQMVVGKTVLS